MSSATQTWSKEITAGTNYCSVAGLAYAANYDEIAGVFISDDGSFNLEQIVFLLSSSSGSVISAISIDYNFASGDDIKITNTYYAPDSV